MLGSQAWAQSCNQTQNGWAIMFPILVAHDHQTGSQNFTILNSDSTLKTSITNTLIKPTTRALHNFMYTCKLIGQIIGISWS